MMGKSAPVLDLDAVRKVSNKSLDDAGDEDDQDLHNARTSAMSARNESGRRTRAEQLIALGRAEEKRRQTVTDQKEKRKTAAAAGGSTAPSAKGDEMAGDASSGVGASASSSSSSAADSVTEKVEKQLLSALVQEKEKVAEDAATAAHQSSGGSLEAGQDTFDQFSFENPFNTHNPRPVQRTRKQVRDSGSAAMICGIGS